MDSTNVLQSIHGTQEMHIQGLQVNEKHSEYTNLQNNQNKPQNQKVQQESPTNYVSQSKKFSELLEQESQKPIKVSSPNIPPQVLQLNQLNQDNNDFSQQELQSYNKMMNQWRKIQRQSINKQVVNNQLLQKKRIKKPVSQEKNQIFEKYLMEIQCYLRAKFIYDEMLEPIHTQKMLNFNDITSLQYIYLISFRAWCEINKAKQKFNPSQQQQQELTEQQKKNGLTKSVFNKYNIILKDQDSNLLYLVEPIYKLSEKIETIFDLYHKSLTYKQKSFMNRLKNLKNYLFNYRAKTQRDRFLCGFEGVDFKREQQIAFTDKYKKTIISAIRQKISQLQSNKIVPKIVVYRQLITTNFQRMQGFDDFDVMKNTMIKQWYAKNKIQQPHNEEAKTCF